MNSPVKGIEFVVKTQLIKDTPDSEGFMGNSTKQLRKE